jgi:ribosomal protein L37AE/L43A
MLVTSSPFNQGKATMPARYPVTDHTWSCLISAPIGRVRLDCPDCSNEITIRAAGAFGCSTCGAAFYARARHMTYASESYLIRRDRPQPRSLATVKDPTMSASGRADRHTPSTRRHDHTA